MRLTYFCLWFTHYILGKSGTKASQQKINWKGVPLHIRCYYILCLSTNWKDVPLHIRSCYILCLPSNAGLDLRIRDFLTFFAGSFHTLGLFTSILCRFQTNLQCKHSGKCKMRWIVVLVMPRMVERRERVIKWAGVNFCEVKKQDIVEMRAALVLLVMIVRLGDAQRRVIGDNQEQRISQVRNHKSPCIYFQKWRSMREDNYLKDPYHQQADIDEREERVYRRPPTYLIIASKIVRPASIYQVRTFPFNSDGPNNDNIIFR